MAVDEGQQAVGLEHPGRFAQRLAQPCAVFVVSRARAAAGALPRGHQFVMAAIGGRHMGRRCRAVFDSVDKRFLPCIEEICQNAVENIVVIGRVGNDGVEAVVRIGQRGGRGALHLHRPAQQRQRVDAGADAFQLGVEVARPGADRIDFGIVPQHGHARAAEGASDLLVLRNPHRQPAVPVHHLVDQAAERGADEARDVGAVRGLQRTMLGQQFLQQHQRDQALARIEQVGVAAHAVERRVDDARPGRQGGRGQGQAGALQQRFFLFAQQAGRGQGIVAQGELLAHAGRRDHRHAMVGAVGDAGRGGGAAARAGRRAASGPARWGRLAIRQRHHVDAVAIGAGRGHHGQRLAGLLRQPGPWPAAGIPRVH
ncbi:Uncharacterised protein [Bordetella pertussis]|nr:Uncharacterised protein [Bordetella pertussis]